MGGHGSDATLRTSEDLNRETFALASTATEDARTPVDRAKEEQLRSAVAASPDDGAANQALGAYYLGIQQYRAAVGPLTVAWKAHKQGAGDTYELALAYRGAGEIAQARELVREGLQRRESADLHRIAGELDEVEGQPVEAVREEERAARLDPSEQNYFVWGSELLLHRAVWQAAEVFQDGVKRYPQSPRMHTALGAALFSEAKYEDAARQLCQAATLNATGREPYIALGKAAIAAPVQLPCAREMLEQFARLRPEDAEANYDLAMVLLKQADPPEPARAEALLRKAVLLNPKYAGAELQLGVMALARKDFTNATEWLKKSIAADPQLGEAHYRLGVVYDRMGDTAAARREYALHEQADAADATRVEEQRRAVKQFVVTSSDQAPVATAH